MRNKKPEAGRLPYTKVSLILDLLRGSIRYFVISIFSALCVTGLDMLSPQRYGPPLTVFWVTMS